MPPPLPDDFLVVEKKGVCSRPNGGSDRFATALADRLRRLRLAVLPD